MIKYSDILSDRIKKYPKISRKGIMVNWDNEIDIRVSGATAATIPKWWLTKLGLDFRHKLLMTVDPHTGYLIIKPKPSTAVSE